MSNTNPLEDLKMMAGRDYGDIWFVNGKYGESLLKVKQKKKEEKKRQLDLVNKGKCRI